VIDLACLSVQLYPHVQSFHIFPEFHGEHLPFCIRLSFPSRDRDAPVRKTRLIRPCGDLVTYYSQAIHDRSPDLNFICESIERGQLSTADAITQLTDIIVNGVALAASKVRGPSTSAPLAAPWWSDELSAARDVERHLRRELVKGKVEFDAWHEAKRQYRRLINHHKKIYYQQHQIDLINTYFSSAQGDFWKVIKPKCSPCHLTDMKAWACHFEKVFNIDIYNNHLTDAEREIKQVLYDLHKSDPDFLIALNNPIQVVEVEQAFDRLPNLKAAGADGITAECFKTAFKMEDVGQNKVKSYYLAPVMTTLLNAVYIKRDFPTQFAINTLSPVYKGKGDINDTNSYRGIAVGSLYCKIFESILYDRYNSALERLHLRNPIQFGFRKQHGTLDGMFVLRHLIDKSLFKGSPLYALFIDFEKAFDRVPREFLIDRCEQLGCSGEFLDAMVNMLDNIQMQIKCNGELGKTISTSNWGIKQGGLLSPLKFGSFMEQLHDLVALKLPGIGPEIGKFNIPLLMYADDVTALVTSPRDMTQLIEYIELFCKLFGMKINVSKTFAVIFNDHKRSGKTHAQLARHCNWFILGQPIEIKDTAKFLGITYHQVKGCEAAPEDLASKGRRASHAMFTAMQGHYINQSAFLCRIFDQLVKPVLSYGCQIWGPDVFCDHLDDHSILSRRKNPLEGVHIDFLRLLGGLPPSSPLWILFNEFQRTPLHFQWIKLCARFWEKIVHSNHENENVLLREAMHDNIQLAVDGCSKCWVAKFIQSLVLIDALSQQALDACVTIHDYTALPITESVVKAKLAQFWESCTGRVLGDSGDPRSIPDDIPNTHVRYQSWVACGGRPAHLMAFLPTHIKHMLLRLRCTSFPLAIQQGRRKSYSDRVPRSKRYCKACLADGLELVEDDKHFLIECRYLSNIRLNYPTIFHDNATPASILNFSDQCLLGKAIQSMLLHRTVW